MKRIGFEEILKTLRATGQAFHLGYYGFPLRLIYSIFLNISPLAPQTGQVPGGCFSAV